MYDQNQSILTPTLDVKRPRPAYRFGGRVGRPGGLRLNSTSHRGLGSRHARTISRQRAVETLVPDGRRQWANIPDGS